MGMVIARSRSGVFRLKLVEEGKTNVSFKSMIKRQCFRLGLLIEDPFRELIGEERYCHREKSVTSWKSNDTDYIKKWLNIFTHVIININAGIYFTKLTWRRRLLVSFSKLTIFCFCNTIIFKWNFVRGVKSYTTTHILVENTRF